LNDKSVYCVFFNLFFVFGYEKCVISGVFN